MGEAGYESRFVGATDGLRLHVRVYGVPQPGRWPLICLAGLSRNSADFDRLARALSATRQVVAPDYRGRGQSDWDTNWQNYALPVELNDLLAVTTVLGIDKAIFLGTSRGGILTMLMSAARPGLIAGAILNDIGPVIDGTGLARIKSYLGKLPEPKNLDEAVALLKSIGSAKFPALSDADWYRQAEGMWMTRDGRLVPAFDPALTKPMETMNFDAPLPTLWPQFDGLANVPAMVIRGEHSDIISAETVAAMVARRPDLGVFDVPGQGHAPLLTDRPSIDRIAEFARRCDPA
ncbi:alpha/beta fold hydrolase [Phreatobacter stygius]|uniref:Alpha/beta hydrolase n=1 Tax=Phreatobacter stygius TaxID=1940610 RepID=A0A4D7BMS4_9HYPH|nr:alpha/beta hydrolase [Phreatobacter stygius]QCI62775.1 alpha/beta hydrolase [Phreatobacter stygius]QCI68952.1 alpha/beta hydrolase [Phreatobacter stygius]